MLFSSIPFLFYFLPITLILYFLVPFKLKNIVLLVTSLLFYFWGEPTYITVMIASSFSAYFLGLFIDKFRGTKWSKFFMILSATIGLGFLGFFKYTGFVVENIDAIFGSEFVLNNINKIFGTGLEAIKIVLPIGISFYTFQILSYTIDLYRGNVGLQKNFFDFLAYVSMFPQLIAGPIVRYADIEKELSKREISFKNISYGVNRFVIGLAKKILLANVLGEFCDIYKATGESTVLFTWAYAIAYALHIYFDFSGYSDMGIGLGKMFGFNFPENFNYPYISKSVTEFWRRWHMTLGTWFRDYVYIPLGGNRVPMWKWFRNIIVVWALTGLWHGASWNFVIWGSMFGVLLIIEKFFLLKLLKKLPAVFSWLYTMVIVLVSWVVFDALSLAEIGTRLSTMFGLSGLPFANADTFYYIESYALVFIVSIFAASPIMTKLIHKIKFEEKVIEGKEEKEIIEKETKLVKIINAFEPLVQTALMILITAYLVDGSFNPFLYFRF